VVLLGPAAAGRLREIGVTYYVRTASDGKMFALIAAMWG
jgi:hypothetical protein